MNKFYIPGVGIDQIAACVPKNTEKIYDPRFTKIVGIAEKRTAPKGINASDLGLAAAKLLDMKGVKFVIFVSQTHDAPIPFVTGKLIDELKLPYDVGTMDINSGCTGWVLGLLQAFLLAKSGHCSVLLVIGDTLARTTGKHDPPSEHIFGDAAAACTVSYKERHDGKESFFSLYSDGTRRDAIIMSENRIYMDGDKVLKFALDEVPKSVNSILSWSGCYPETYIFHQSNMSILKHFKKHIPDFADMPTSLELFGNTSGASIPLTIVTNNIQGNVMMCGYGSGLSWGTAIMTLDCEIKKLIEV